MKQNVIGLEVYSYKAISVAQVVLRYSLLRKELDIKGKKSEKNNKR